jgi:hypothetical protein
MEAIKMSESQSRYSIVERLTTGKMLVMEEKQKLGEIIAAKRLQIQQNLNRIKDRKMSLQKELSDYETEQKMYNEILEQEIVSLEAGKDSRVKLYDRKIVEIDKALEAIIKISKEESKSQSSKK